MWQTREIPYRIPSLQQLSLDALTGSACKLWRITRNHSFGGRKWTKFASRKWLEGCRWFKQTICKVPPSKASEVTLAIILALDKINFGQYIFSKHRVLLEHRQKLLEAILHPDISELILNLDDVEEFTCQKNLLYMIPLICEFLFKLPKLTIIRFPLNDFESPSVIYMIPQGVALPIQLVEFTVPYYTTDALLEGLATSCSQLNHLDINHSRLVYDISVKSILKMKQLEHLNILNTSIQSKGIKRLLGNAIMEQLKFFGFSTPFLIPLPSVSGMQNLVSLDIDNVTITSFSCMQLKTLQNLKHVIIRGTSSPSLDSEFMRKLIKVLGSQLEELDLAFMNRRMFRLMMQHCTSLRCLKLRDTNHIETGEEGDEEQNNLEMTSLTSLYLNIHQTYQTAAYILSTCVNLKKLCLQTRYVGLESRLMGEAFIRNQLTHLEELAWSESSDVLERVLTQYSELKTVRGYDYIWRKEEL